MSTPSEEKKSETGSGGQLGQVGAGVGSLADGIKKLAEVFKNGGSGIVIVILIIAVIYLGWEKKGNTIDTKLAAAQQKQAVDSVASELRKLMDERHEDDVKEKIELKEELKNLTQTNQRLQNSLDVCQSSKR